jgi:hypothetical protein
MTLGAVALLAGVAGPGGAAQPAETCFARAATHMGTPGADTIVGTPGDDVIIGGEGDDVLKGRGGRDRICGGAGNDTLVGNAGGDRLKGGPGSDLLKGRGGKDKLAGSGGRDRLLGGRGDDTLRGGAGDDELDGGAGIDALNGGGGTDSCLRGESNRQCEGSGAGRKLLDPDALTYLGTFRLPPGEAWAWSGAALTYNPDGDPSGPSDGYPGSLFGTGHNWYQEVSEISIPVPIVTAQVGSMNAAGTLQGFRNIREDFYDFDSFEIPRVALEYLGGRLHFAWGQHFEDEGPVATHGWTTPDLSDLSAVGPWAIEGTIRYSSNDYIFAIEPHWAAIHTPDYPLATGRFRDGGWGGQGPSLHAYLPGEVSGPAPAAELPAVTLLQYGSSLGASPQALTGYHHSDEWTGGAWVDHAGGTAVLFVGTKGLGDCWYGFENGVVWPDEPPYPEWPDPPYDDRGWWSTEFEAQILFYDPADLAGVAAGALEPHEPQPYATLSIDDILLGERRPSQQYRTGGVAFDGERGVLYVMEGHVDGERPVIHVWQIAA